MSRRPAMSHARAGALGWVRIDPRPWSKCSALWRHHDRGGLLTGWLLKHCGHPTANTPWMLHDPSGKMILTGVRGLYKDPTFGTCWPTIEMAFQYVATVVKSAVPSVER